MVRYLWLLIVLLAAFAGVGSARLMPGEVAEQPAEAKPVPRSEPVGSVGCSASACHGKPDQKALTEKPGPECWKSSAMIYHALDPHQKAYAALLTPLGKRIASKLNTGIPANEDVRCLACHTNPSLAVPTANAALRSEGVSCEACHGDASAWFAPHTLGKGFGLSQMPNGPGTVCAGCHIGAPADKKKGIPVRDMNHDMIAAGHPALYGWPPYAGMPFQDASEKMIALGHPALNQDFQKLLQRYPKHFREKQYPKPELPNEPFVTALVELNKSRTKPLPEFADGSKKCIDCHKVLTGKVMPK